MTVKKEILLIDREFGAGASTIGEILAKRLGWKLFDDELSHEIAKLAKLPVDICRRHEERRDPVLARLINLIWKGSFHPNLPSPDLTVLDTDRLVALIQKVVEDAAGQKPCVIIGRGAPYFLRQRMDIFSVFLYAPRELKYQRLLKRVGDEKKALDLVDTIDEDRRKFVKHYFGHEWPNHKLFDVMINTQIGDEETVETILHMLKTANTNKETTYS